MKIDISMITEIYTKDDNGRLSWWMDQRGFTVRISRIDKRFILCIALYRTTKTVKLSKIDTLYRYRLCACMKSCKKYSSLAINSSIAGRRNFYRSRVVSGCYTSRIKERLKGFKIDSVTIVNIGYEN